MEVTVMRRGLMISKNSKMEIFQFLPQKLKYKRRTPSCVSFMFIPPPSDAAKAPFKPVPKRACPTTKDDEVHDMVEDMLAGIEDLATLAEAIAAKLGIDLTEDGASGDTDTDEDSDEQ